MPDIIKCDQQSGVTLNGTLPSDTIIRLESIDLGMDEIEQTWIEPSGASRPTLTKTAVRKTQMTFYLWLEATDINSLISDAKLVQAGFLIPNVVNWSPAYPSVPVEQLQTYRSAVPPLLNQSNLENIRYLISQNKVFDWVIPVWRNPYPVGTTVPLLV